MKAYGTAIFDEEMNARAKEFSLLEGSKYSTFFHNDPGVDNDLINQYGQITAENARLSMRIHHSLRFLQRNKGVSEV